MSFDGFAFRVIRTPHTMLIEQLTAQKCLSHIQPIGHDMVAYWRNHPTLLSMSTSENDSASFAVVQLFKRALFQSLIIDLDQIPLD